MIKALHKMGIRSGMMYMAGVMSVGASIVSWNISRQHERSRMRADHWGIFVGEWAPTFFAIGLALRMEEMREEVMTGMPEEEEERHERMGRRFGRRMTAGV
ncbi:hypothetical protein Sru01_68460 [Sphaerisporangium rufum]|uniref:Uncharacterized protein n=1 Tax=Sphaerisporangium rufum TaxID=1381558 RepID=A0A919R948_9ACTN|nr:hypothetical protein [Sphaerisporangium rufum]GII81864.1 hypothetical protein Sru01_68460 [Sphaerisporangium rufum]